MAFNFNMNMGDLLPTSTSGSGNSTGSGTASSSGTKTTSTKKVLSAEAMDKIMRDILGSEQGMAALATGESAAGLSGTTVKTQLAQDFMVKLAGELGALTAENVSTEVMNTKQEQTQQQTQQQSSKKKVSVICTELVRQGSLPKELYLAGEFHFLSLSPITIRGYQCWGMKVVEKMQKSPKLSATLLPVVLARYEHISGTRKNLLGALTVHLGQPICYLIGLFVKESSNGYATAS